MTGRPELPHLVAVANRSRIQTDEALPNVTSRGFHARHLAKARAIRLAMAEAESGEMRRAIRYEHGNAIFAAKGERSFWSGRWSTRSYALPA